MKVAVSEFKAKCSQYFRDIGQTREAIEVTRKGTVIAIVSPPPPVADVNPAWGSLRGTLTHIAEDFDEPMGDDEWDAGR